MAPRCNVCKGTGYEVLAVGERARAQVCGCQASCGVCGGQRFVIRVEGGYEVAAPCACVSLHERVRLFNEAGVPANYADKSVSNFSHGPSEPSLAEAKTRFMRYQKSARVDRARGIVLAGPPGVGKTHLLCAFVNHATLQRGIACRFVDFFELTARIRETFGARDGDSEGSLLEPLVDVPVLAIDDLGKGRGSSWELTIIDQLITRRYNAGRIVLATTNFLPEQAPEPSRPGAARRGAAESLEERIGERLFSRLCEMADIVVLQGFDRRRDGGPRAAPRRPAG